MPKNLCVGAYESLLAKLLHQHPIALAVVNPRRVSSFAIGIGRDAKTDHHPEHTRPHRSTVAESCNCTNENGALMTLSPERRRSVIDAPKQQAIPRAVASP